MKLYEIDAQLEALFDQETGEILDPALWDVLSMEREKKLENVACWIKNLESDAEALKAEKTALAEREAKARKKADSLREWLATALQGQKMATSRCEISFRKSEAVEVVDEEQFVMWAEKNYPGLLSWKNPTPDKKAIKQTLKNGEFVPGVTIIEKQNMSIK